MYRDARRNLHLDPKGAIREILHKWDLDPEKTFFSWDDLIEAAYLLAWGSIAYKILSDAAHSLLSNNYLFAPTFALIVPVDGKDGLFTSSVHLRRRAKHTSEDNNYRFSWLPYDYQSSKQTGLLVWRTGNVKYSVRYRDSSSTVKVDLGGGKYYIEYLPTRMSVDIETAKMMVFGVYTRIRTKAFCKKKED
jgi:hypothetical protein